MMTKEFELAVAKTMVNKLAAVAAAQSKQLEAMKHVKEVSIERVIFNEPYTIVLWSDNTNTMVRCRGNDVFDKEKGFALAMIKKMMGNTDSYYEVLKKYIK